MGHGMLKEILSFTSWSALEDTHTHTEGEATKPVSPF